MSYDNSHVKARKKAVKQVKNSNAHQLEIETKKMEERIRALKEQMFKEKEEREKSGGTKWASARAGPLNSHAQEVLKNKSSKEDKSQKRIKILGDEPLQSYKKKIAARAQPSDDIGTPVCGQCERARASLVCVECSEKYCVSCFMSFHRKGALKKHNAQSVNQHEGILQEKNSTTADLLPAKTDTRASSQALSNSLRFRDSIRHQGGSLLEGSYNEEESAQSFAQALMEWRKSIEAEKMWRNPTNDSSSTCETSTTPEPIKKQEIQLTFGANKSLSYFDRMLLKKHHGNPNFISQSRPLREVKSKSTKPTSPKDDTQIETEKHVGTNYRGVFQTLGAPNGKTPQNYTERKNFTLSDSGMLIEEVDGDHPSNWEETADCIVEEQDTHPYPERRPVSRSSRVRIMSMTKTGNFEADSDALQLNEVSPMSYTSPVSDRPSTQGVAVPHLNLAQNVNTKSHVKDGFGRVWSRQPCHVGLSKFFLAGVTDAHSFERKSRVKRTELSPSFVNAGNLSKSLLSKNVWKPRESVSDSEDGQIGLGKRQRQQSLHPAIPLLLEPGIPEKNHDRLDHRLCNIAKPVSNDTHYDSKINDFGILDFLQMQPHLPSGFEENSLIHRVSTVSPLTLSPNPPSFHWSDDSDEEFLELIYCRAMKAEQRADQDEADRETLTDLAWELASTTGRLTRGELDKEENHWESDQDSIENNDFGSGLSSSEEEPAHDSYHSQLSSETKDKDGNTLAEAEVHALE